MAEISSSSHGSMANRDGVRIEVVVDVEWVGELTAEVLIGLIAAADGIWTTCVGVIS